MNNTVNNREVQKVMIETIIDNLKVGAYDEVSLLTILSRLPQLVTSQLDKNVLLKLVGFLSYMGSKVCNYAKYKREILNCVLEITLGREYRRKRFL